MTDLAQENMPPAIRELADLIEECLALRKRSQAADRLEGRAFWTLVAKYPDGGNDVPTPAEIRHWDALMRVRLNLGLRTWQAEERVRQAADALGWP